ncbi:MarR family winged helix-turn-helix transcriptional regulator [Ornithinibacillus sp. 179-J 7C1 HS]|uniref:MarR family winged helix-turn-helix transcriptional regulator n=1 Tax=Ornithinibacillus sp. 179-J 7C1 HS TaxID=3142384 RepID=UPI0039A0E2A6
MINRKLIHLLNQQVRYINKNLNERIQDHDLYNAQWSILYFLHENGAKTQTEITNYFHVNAPTITRTVKRMEENGWINRVVGQDRRHQYIELSHDAKEKYKEIEKVVSEHEEEMLSNLSREEKELLLSLLQKLK